MLQLSLPSSESEGSRKQRARAGVVHSPGWCTPRQSSVAHLAEAYGTFEAANIAASRRLPAFVIGCCLAVILMLHVTRPQPGPVRQASGEVGGHRLSTRPQASPDRRQFLTMVAHAPVAAVAAEAGGAAATAFNGASPAQLDAHCSDEYPTIEHQAGC